MESANPDIGAGLRLYREGRLPEALAVFDRVLAADARHAQARGMRGLVLCHLDDFDRGVGELRAAIEIAPRDAFLHTSLGMIFLVQDRLDDAQSSLRRALALSPNHPEALVNLGLVLKAQGDFAGSERASRAALRARPQAFEARINLAYVLLAQGKFAEGWEAYCTRPDPQVNLRDPAVPVTVPHDPQLPAAGAPVIVHGEQGLGDTLFFLRFAPLLAARGHPLAFWGDPRLQPLLARTALFQHFLRPEAVPGPGIAVIWCGDLPRLLAMTDPGAFPPPLALTPERARVEAMRARLAAWGPAPYVGVTWRAGLDRKRRIVLAKSVDPRLLGAALSAVEATFVSLQRNPLDEELRAFAADAGKPLHDAAFVNDDLEDALALLEGLDEYLGVSNTNTHLRAGLGKPARVLVPWPPEWRWLERGERSPWFRDAPTYRQSPRGEWGGALGAMTADLASYNPRAR
jgi:Flp pilus assembly protein TadD